MQLRLYLHLHLLVLVARRASSLSSTPPPFLFRRFSFAPNGVCVRPETFSDCSDPSDDDHRTFSMRNVPGEGDCMFMAVALATATSMGLGGNDALLRAIAAETRSVVAQVLGSSRGNLHVEGKRMVSARDLLRSASRGEGLAEEDYLERLRMGGAEGGLYGGGPELTVLSNVLRRPISIYELHEDELRALAATTEADGRDGEQMPGAAVEILPMKCRIKCVGVFGDFFKDKCLAIPDSAVLSGLQPGAFSWHLHILVVQANPNEKHACVLLPNFCDEA